MATVVHVNDQDFKAKVLTSSTPVLVDFYADWCAPCKMLSPIIEQLSDDYVGAVKVAKLDVDAAPDTAATFGVMGVPTVILFIEGKPTTRLTGYEPKASLKKKIDSALAAAGVAQAVDQ